MEVFDRKTLNDRLEQISFCGSGVAFDLEGTCVNLEAIRHSAHLIAAESFGIRMEHEEAVRSLEHFLGGPDEKVAEDFWEISRENIRLPDRDSFIRDFLSRDHNLFKDLFTAERIEPRKGLPNFVESLLELGICVSIGSLTGDEQALEILRR